MTTKKRPIAPQRIEGTAGQTLPEPEAESGQPQAESGSEQQAAEPAPFAPAVLLHATITAPLGSVDPVAYASDHIDGRLDPLQASGLRHLYNGLDAAGKRLRNGRRVLTSIDAVRWLLEELARKMPNDRPHAQD